MTATIHPTERRPAFRGEDGVPTFAKRFNDKTTHDFDESDARWKSGETIDTVTWVTSGPTLSAESVTGDYSFRVTVLGDGEATATITGDAGTVLERRYRWTASDRRVRDYQC